jgi:hypothetical protein
MPRAPEPGRRLCVEVVALAFGDTNIDVAHVHEGSPAYRIGEGPAVRVPVGGIEAEEPAGLKLVWAEAGGFWLADRGQQILLEEGETIWVEHGTVRFRVCLTAREDVEASTWSVDRPYLGSLSASAIVVAAFLGLVRAQPAMPIDEEQHRVTLARLLDSERAVLEPVPGPQSDVVRSLEPTLEGRSPASTPDPRPADPRARGSKRRQPLWVPVGPAQAVGQLGRSYDPVEAARQAGILAVLGDRPFAGERVYDREIDDAALWASTAELDLDIEPIGTPSRSTGEGLVGWGSYGQMHLGQWREGHPEAHEIVALRTGDCRRAARPPRPTMVQIGRVDGRGGTNSEIARRIVRAHVPELRRCVDDTTSERTLDLNGDVELSVVRGKVGSVVIDPAFPDGLADCMKRTIRRWRFPAGPTAELGMVDVSLRLSR